MDEQVLHNLSIALKKIGLKIKSIHGDKVHVSAGGETIGVQMLQGGGYIVDDNALVAFMLHGNKKLVEEASLKSYCIFDGDGSVYCYAADLSSLPEAINNVVRCIQIARATIRAASFA